MHAQGRDIELFVDGTNGVGGDCGGCGGRGWGVEGSGSGSGSGGGGGFFKDKM